MLICPEADGAGGLDSARRVILPGGVLAVGWVCRRGVQARWRGSYIDGYTISGNSREHLLLLVDG